MKARTLLELALYIEEHPCPKCGTAVTVDELEITFGAAPSVRQLQTHDGLCRSCSGPLHYVFECPDAWPPSSGTLSYGGEPSEELFSRSEWRALAEKTAAPVHGEPASLAPKIYFEQLGRAIRARAQLAEASKLGLDVAEREAELDDLCARYLALKDEMTARYRREVPPAPAPTTFGKVELAAHAEWLARGRSGAGRMVLEGNGLGGMPLGNVRLTAARLTRVSFAGATVDFAQFAEAELSQCSGRRANFSHTVFDGAVFERCRFSESSFVLADLRGVVFEGGTFDGCNFDRGTWVRARAKGTSFRGSRFGDAVLDGATFEDCDLRDADFGRIERILSQMCSTLGTTFARCDLRGANFEGRRLSGTRFIDCAFADLRGTPAIEGAYVVERPDFSPGADGSDVRGPEPIHARWGRPRG